MTQNFVTLTGTYENGTGAGVDGSEMWNAFLTFVPTAELTDATNNRRVPVTPIRVRLAKDGSFSVQLLATDNATVLPSGWGWQVTETIPGVPDFTWQFFLPSAGGSPQDISDLTPLPSGATAVLDESAQAILAEG